MSARARLAAAVSLYLRTYHRHEVVLDKPIPESPALVVGNHGFGGILDLNVLAMMRVLAEHQDRRVTYLVHQIAWTLGAGPLVEAYGGRPASSAAAQEAFDAAHHVAVFPGGDVDAGKSWADRNRITFSGRTGFARCAIEHGVPIVPVVTAGAGESLLVLDDGQWLARRLPGVHRLRIKAHPISVSVPWGLNVGLVGMLPWTPLPTKLRTAVLAPMTPEPDESVGAFAARVETAMQTRLDELVADRVPVLG